MDPLTRMFTAVKNDTRLRHCREVGRLEEYLTWSKNLEWAEKNGILAIKGKFKNLILD